MKKQEIINLLIDTLQAIEEIAERTTTGNISHNIPSIRALCINAIEFCKEENKVEDNEC